MTTTKKLKPDQRLRLNTFLSVLGLLVWVFAVLIFSQLFIGFIMVAMIGSDAFSEAIPTAIYSLLTYLLSAFLIIFVPIMFFRKLHKKVHIFGRIELGFRGLPTWTDIGLSVAGLIIALVFAALLEALFMLFPWFNADEVQNIGYNLSSLSGLECAFAFFSLAVIAPIMEELIFRGWLYAKLRTKLSLVASEKISIFLSILLTSLLFALIHGQWNVGLSVFALSVVMCGLREITGTIYAGILVHILKNSLAFFLLYLGVV